MGADPFRKGQNHCDEIDLPSGRSEPFLDEASSFWNFVIVGIWWIVAIAIAVVLVCILYLRLHAFLALILAGFLVCALVLRALHARGANR